MAGPEEAALAQVLSLTAEYALRAVAWFAAEPPGTRALARDLSRSVSIPAGYLAKILRRLVVAGVLESRKGQGGGFALACDPSRLTFAEVLEAVDAFPEPGRCAFGWGQCNARRPCPLHGPWSQMSESFRAWAETTTFGRGSSASARPKRKRAAARVSKSATRLRR